MKAFSQIAVLCLAAVACGRTVVPRDLATITESLGHVQDKIDVLDTAVKAFNGDAGPVREGAENLVNTINTESSSVQASEPLNKQDTASLLAPVNNLKAHAKDLSNDFKAHRADVAAAKQCDETRQQLHNILTATTHFINIIVGKVDHDYKGIAEEQANEIVKILQDILAYFGPDQCRNAA